MANVDMKALLEAGVHFGHRTQKWNPRMKQYIFTERNGIHIIDLQQTVKALEDAYKVVRNLVADGGTVLFVGTKRQATETIEAEAQRCEMPYVTVRWLGGMLTNWQTMRQRINELERLERMRERGDFERLTKREALTLTRQIDKLEDRFGGIRNITRQPDLLFVIDVRREETAVREANILGIPVLGLVDTNCDPTVIDHVVPSNDDAIRAIKLMVANIADAVIEGRAMRKEDDKEKPGKGEGGRKARAAQAEELTDEELLGEATLAKVAEAQAEAEAVAEAEAAALAAKEAAAAEAEAEATVDSIEEKLVEAKAPAAESKAEAEKAEATDEISEVVEEVEKPKKTAKAKTKAEPEAEAAEEEKPKAKKAAAKTKAEPEAETAEEKKPKAKKAAAKPKAKKDSKTKE
jgi:small subunit ribosomal protein S2